MKTGLRDSPATARHHKEWARSVVREFLLSKLPIPSPPSYPAFAERAFLPSFCAFPFSSFLFGASEMSLSCVSSQTLYGALRRHCQSTSSSAVTSAVRAAAAQTRGSPHSKIARVRRLHLCRGLRHHHYPCPARQNSA